MRGDSDLVVRLEEVPAVSRYLTHLADTSGDHVADAYARTLEGYAAKRMGVEHAVWEPSKMLWRADCPECGGMGEVDRSCPTDECTYMQHTTCGTCASNEAQDRGGS